MRAKLLSERVKSNEVRRQRPRATSAVAAAPPCASPCPRPAAPEGRLRSDPARVRSLFAAAARCSVVEMFGGVVLRAASSISSALFVPIRGNKGMVRAKPAHEGWPRLSRDGWPFARYLKMKMKGKYVSKQEQARRAGTNKGRAKMSLMDKMTAVPEYEIIKHGPGGEGPVVNAAGLRRRL